MMLINTGYLYLVSLTQMLYHTKVRLWDALLIHSIGMRLATCITTNWFSFAPIMYNVQGNCGYIWSYFRHFLADSNEKLPNSTVRPVIGASANWQNFTFDEVVQCW